MYTGLERLLRHPELARDWGNCGLLANQASVTIDGRWAPDALHELLGPRLKALFAPQHGFWGTEQDNMIETPDGYSARWQIPVYSLYSTTREPTPEMLEGVDTLVIDLQTAGCRVYTFKYTLVGCLRVARQLRKRVVVLDRPNPVGGVFVEGRVLDDDSRSFVGEFPLPMRHALTIGEAAGFFNTWIGADLEVIKLEGWDCGAWDRARRPWIMPSPNLPSPEATAVYPGMVMIEGTNISEGRGTSLPFQLVGAPYLRDEQMAMRFILDQLEDEDMAGLWLRPVRFRPTSGKWVNETCFGVQVHVSDMSAVRPFNLTLAIIRTAIELGGPLFAWKQPPYEYEYQRMPMQLISGSGDAIERLERGFVRTDQFWSAGVESYIGRIRDHLLYERELKAVLPS